MSPANILLVDDNDDVREVTALLLRDSGYHVIAASSGSAALEVLGGDSAIDLLIVDFAMPGIPGSNCSNAPAPSARKSKRCLSPAMWIMRSWERSLLMRSW